MRTVHDLQINTVSTAFEPPLSEAAAEAWIPWTCFKNGPPSRTGIELELLVVDCVSRTGTAEPYPSDRYPALLRALNNCDLDGHPIDGAITLEPGGQVELSSRPADTLQDTLDTVRRDLSAMRSRAGQHGARLVGIGMDPQRSPERITQNPRYAAMERYFDAWGPAGRSMMCSTASVQVNVEAGVDPVQPAADRIPVILTGAIPTSAIPTAAIPTSAIPTEAIPTEAMRSRIDPLRGFTQRWHLLHAIGPALIAAFANSPQRAGRATGWKSSRQQVWLQLDPARTGVPQMRSGEDVTAAFTRWALDAPLMMVRRANGSWAAPSGLTFRSWLRLGTRAVPDRPAPTVDDLEYHLTTMFPQVRPKGYLEVRYIDAQPGSWWTVPCAVIGTLLGDTVAADRALDICAPVADRWRDGARLGMADPELARAAQRTLLIAATSLEGSGQAGLAGHVHGYLEKWTDRGRCPADDIGADYLARVQLTDENLSKELLSKQQP